MRVLILNDYATATGGAEAMTLTLRDGLRRRGHDARLFASRAGAGVEPIEADYECFGTTSRYRTLLQSANPWAASALRRALADFRPDVVHVRMFLTQLSPLILPLLREHPSLYHVVWYRPVCPKGTKMLPDGTTCHMSAGAVCHRYGCLPRRDWVPLMAQMRLWRRWRDAFDAIVANSRAVGARLEAEGIGPVEVVWNGVPITAERPPLDGPPTAVFAGRLVEEKGADVLVRAFARAREHMPDARLVLAGRGPQEPRLRALVAELGLREAVTLAGRLPREELERRFASAWVQVVPSRWEEPFGIAAAEAMMRGTAVIASASGGLAEIVDHGRTGLLVASGDTEGFARALASVLGDRALAERLGAAGRLAALADLTEDTFVERHLELYERLVAGRRSSATYRSD